MSIPRATLLCALLACLCCGQEGSPGAESGVSRGGRARATRRAPVIELRNSECLVAEVRLETPQRTQRWWPIRFALGLRNPSRENFAAFVMPGDIEPSVAWEFEAHDGDGEWYPVEGGRWRCGTIGGRDWLSRVRVLGPREQRRITSSYAPGDWLPASAVALRARARYRYNAIGAVAAPPKTYFGDEVFGGMAGIEPFELVSDYAEVRVARPRFTRERMEGALRLEWVDAPEGLVSAMEPIELRARLVNRSELTLPVVAPPYASRDPGPAAGVELEATFDGERAWMLDRHWRVDRTGASWGEPAPSNRVVHLAPGEWLEVALGPLQEWTRPQGRQGELNLELRYAYEGRVHHAGGEGLSGQRLDELGALRDVPPHAVRSEPLRLQVVAPLEIRFVEDAQGAVHAIEVTNPNEVSVELSSEAVPCTLEALHTDTRTFVTNGYHPVCKDSVRFRPRVLAPGETFELTDADLLTCDETLLETFFGTQPPYFLEVSLAREAWYQELRVVHFDQR